MSALDDAYRAAEDAQVRPHPEGGTYLDCDPRIAIEAFLAHLADNPPDEMVEAVLTSPHGPTVDTYPWARDRLAAALRAIGGETVAPAVAEEGADYPEPRRSG